MDPRFLKGEGSENFTGNELLLKGALEAGVALLTGYPGSPVADVFDSASQSAAYLRERGMLAQLANNEALAAARLHGSQLAGVRALAVFKSVGFHVAADALVTASMAKHGHQGGALVVVGDDPWSDTTQAPVDSRRLSDHLFLPVLEPSTYQEVKDWIDLGFQLSEASDLYLTFLLITYLAEGGGTVDVKPNRKPQGASTLNKIVLDPATFDPSQSVMLPPYTAPMEETALKVKFPALLEAARKLGLNRLIPGTGKGGPVFVTAGASYTYLVEALRQFDLDDRFPILKLGLTYPVDPQAVALALAHSDTLIVVEEKRRFIESQVRDIVTELRQAGKAPTDAAVWGKTFPAGLAGFPMERGLNPALVMKTLAPLLERYEAATPKVREKVTMLEELGLFEVAIPARTATFCPGCPHRDTSSVFLELVQDLADPGYMRRNHQAEPVKVLFHGDAGCYSMLFMPPNGPLMNNYIGMGFSPGTGAGLSPFASNKAVAFLGDSTFFHSGISGMSDALKNNQDILFVLLDNKTTAMTGHQPHAGMDRDLMGNLTFAQDIEKALQGLSEGQEVTVARVNPEDRKAYRELLEKLVLEDGVKFVVADKECGITYHRRLRRERGKELKEVGYLRKEVRIGVSQDTCEFCLECTRLTGCPGLTIEPTLYGPKMATDLSTCVTDGACARVKACPAFEEVTIERSSKPPKPALPDASGLPQPALFSFKGDWRCHIAGVGGMGIGASTAILVRAATHQGLFVTFCDKKGIAIRNGGVYSQITLSDRRRIVSPLMAQGQADLLLGLDNLEAARGLDPRLTFRVGSKDRTHSLVNTGKMPTIRTLMGQEDFSPAFLGEIFKKYTLDYFGADLSHISQDLMGNKLYVNVMMLGVAFQKGFLPLSLANLEMAIGENFRGSEGEANLKAFHLGRDMAAHPEAYQAEVREDWKALADRKAKDLGGRGKAYRALLSQFEQAWNGEAEFLKDVADRLYELIQYDSMSYARKYLDRVLDVLSSDRAERQWAATRATVKYLHKVMAIKDEVYVAHLLTSPEKYRRDRKRWGVDPSRGDKLTYKHFNRPSFEVMGMKLEFDLDSRDWMLKSMKHLKILRALLPSWHKNEKDFRAWYEALVDRFPREGKGRYDTWVKVLELPEEVRGYREIRYPKMDRARLEAEKLLSASVPTTAPQREPVGV